MKNITIRFIEVYNYLLKIEKVSNASDFAKRIEISTSLMNEILKGRSNTGIKPIQNTVNTFNEISLEWLIQGKGKMLKLENEEEKKLQEKKTNDEIAIQFIETQKDLLKYKDDEIKRLKQEIEVLKKSITTSNVNENVIKQSVKKLNK